MLFKRLETAGLSHYAYLIGDGHEAVVIDPRRDCEEYLKEASSAGMRITHILETHRNEDYCNGSIALAGRSGAEVWHADAQLDYKYGKPVKDGQQWQVGRFLLKAMHTPGHTEGSMSYVLHEEGGHPWLVFTGDTLFAGDVGRTDLLGEEKLKEMSEHLYHSIFEKVLLLGDGVLVCPAHGPGSACGTQIVDRPWTTIGLEKMLNPRLAVTDKGRFIAQATMLERPPHFLEMERLNLQGAKLPEWFPTLRPLSAPEFQGAATEAAIVDVRSDLSFSGAHIPGALSIWLGGLAGFAGWFLPYDKPILLVGEQTDLDYATHTLVRMGYDRLSGYLVGEMVAWRKAGFDSVGVETVTVQELCHRLDHNEEPWILDVRAEEELKQNGRIPNACHIHLTQLPKQVHDIPRDREIYIFCASGVRSMVAASLLQQHEFTRVTVVLGGFSGWTSSTCHIKK